MIQEAVRGVLIPITAELREDQHRRLPSILGIRFNFIPQHAGQAVRACDRLKVKRVGSPVRDIHVPEVHEDQARRELAHDFARDEEGQLIAGSRRFGTVDVFDQSARQRLAHMPIQLLPALKIVQPTPSYPSLRIASRCRCTFSRSATPCQPSACYDCPARLRAEVASAGQHSRRMACRSRVEPPAHGREALVRGDRPGIGRAAPFCCRYSSKRVGPAGGWNPKSSTRCQLPVTILAVELKCDRTPEFTQLLIEVALPVGTPRAAECCERPRA